jgi:hypothetical protein
MVGGLNHRFVHNIFCNMEITVFIIEAHSLSLIDVWKCRHFAIYKSYKAVNIFDSSRVMIRISEKLTSPVIWKSPRLARNDCITRCINISGNVALCGIPKFCLFPFIGFWGVDVQCSPDLIVPDTSVWRFTKHRVIASAVIGYEPHELTSSLTLQMLQRISWQDF